MATKSNPRRKAKVSGGRHVPYPYKPLGDVIKDAFTLEGVKTYTRKKAKVNPRRKAKVNPRRKAKSTSSIMRSEDGT
jgi:hypothetical protein